MIDSLCKTFGFRTALDHLQLSLQPGIVALLGANGSGKSTLLRVLATLDHPDDGFIEWNGLDYVRDVERLRRWISYLPEELELPEEMTPRRLLTYLARIRLVRQETQIDRLLSALNLTDVSRRPLIKLSGGQIRLVGIAQALLGAPELLLLDEPFNGLSFDERRRACNLLERQASGRLVIFSTHIPAEAERLAQQVVVLRRGRVAFCGTPQAMLDRAQGWVHEIEIQERDLVDSLQRYKVSRVNKHAEGITLRIVCQEGIDSRAHPVTPSLEDAYLLVNENLRDDLS